MAKKLLITGGAGFIGSSAADYFIQKGWEVTLLDNLSRRGVELNLAGLEKKHPGLFRFVKADIRYDLPVLAEEVAKHDAVLHLAAQVAVTTSVLDPRTDFEINALGTLNLLEAIRASANKPAIIYASTNKVYGDLEHLEIAEEEKRYHHPARPNGISEEHTLDFHSPYGVSKGAADQYVRDYARIYGLDTVVFRQSCIYGEKQYGIEDQGWIAWFVIAHILGKPITLYGNGKQVRDVLFVDDLVRAYEAAFENMSAVRGSIYNIGGGAENSISIIELFDLLRGSHGFEIKHGVAPVRPGDQKVFISDNSKLFRELGWEPKVGVREGVPRLVVWVREHLPVIQSLY